MVYKDDQVEIMHQPLPCPQLQELKLVGMQWGRSTASELREPHCIATEEDILAAEAAGQEEPALSACTGLTQLRVKYSILMPHSVAAISALQQLRHLSLQNLQGHLVAYMYVLPCVLAGLQHLTYLELCSVTMGDGTLEQISRLPRLQHLRLEPVDGFVRTNGGCRRVATTAAGVQLLGQLSQLTALELGRLRFDIGPSTTPGLSQLTGLQRLQLQVGHHFGPGVFAGATQLQHLELLVESEAPDAGTEEAVVEWIPQLQHLRHLQLTGWDLQEVSGAMCAPLTSSSVLGCLHLSRIMMRWSAWELVFPKGRHLSELCTPVLQSCELDTSGAGRISNMMFRHDHLERIVQCCPGLRRLGLSGSLRPGNPLAALGQLQHLEALALGMRDCNTVEVGQLTTLTSLWLDEYKGRNHPVVAGLFALKGLHELVLVMNSPSYLRSEEKRWAYTNQVSGLHCLLMLLPMHSC